METLLLFINFHFPSLSSNLYMTIVILLQLRLKDFLINQKCVINKKNKIEDLSNVILLLIKIKLYFCSIAQSINLSCILIFDVDGLNNIPKYKNWLTEITKSFNHFRRSKKFKISSTSTKLINLTLFLVIPIFAAIALPLSLF